LGGAQELRRAGAERAQLTQRGRVAIAGPRCHSARARRPSRACTVCTARTGGALPRAGWCAITSTQTSRSRAN